MEIDGGQHYTELGQTQDSRRDAYLNDIGLSVLRFSNLDVLGNIDGVIIDGVIAETVQSTAPRACRRHRCRVSFGRGS